MKCTMVLDQKNQYSDHECAPRGNLSLRSFTLIFSYSAVKSLSNHQWCFSLTWNKNFTICVETQKTSNEQITLEKWQKWRNQPSWRQTIVQSYSHQDCKTLCQRQNYRSMEQNGKSRDEATHPRPLVFDRGGINMQRSKGNFLNKHSGKTGQPH